MINKKNLWFLTLFSLVLVLSVYYITMPNELLVTNNGNITNTIETNIEVEESDVISVLKVEDNNDTESEISVLKETLTNNEATVEEKNIAFETLKSINQNSSKEEKLEKKLKDSLKLNTFIKIDKTQIRVVVGSKEHSVELANNIMRSVQEEFDSKKYISVEFQS